MAARLYDARHGRVTCAHCGLEDATCCQCAGSRTVAYAVAEKSVSWVWAFGACPCAACARLRPLRAALEAVA